MEQLLIEADALQAVLSVIVFALMLVAALISFSRNNLLYDLWKSAVLEGRGDKISQQDLLQPWIVRIYQRARSYRSFGVILLCITAIILFQVLYQHSLTYTPTLSSVFFLLHTASMIAVSLSLLYTIFSTHIGLREEVREIQKLLPNYIITLENLMKLHDSDNYFSIKDLPKK